MANGEFILINYGTHYVWLILQFLMSCFVQVKETESMCQGTIFTTSARDSNGHQYAVEVLLPPKSYRNLKGEVTGSQRWKEKLMESWGCKILRIEGDTWDKFGNDDAAKNKYLTKVIAAC